MMTRANIIPSLKCTGLICLCALSMNTITGCGDKRVEYLDNPHQEYIIGPEGGVVKFTDPECWASGVIVEIPPGALDHDRWFWITTNHRTYLPAGFRGVVRNDCFAIETGGNPPDSLELHITFPTEGISCIPDSLEILCPFYYHEGNQAWQPLLPTALFDTTMTMTLKTTYRERWSWGVVALDELNDEQTLTLFMEDIHGEEEWSELLALISQIKDEIEGSYEDEWDMSCPGIITLRDMFDNLRARSEENLGNFQSQLGNLCGTCNVTTLEFFDEMVGYIRLRVRMWFFEQWLFSVGGPGGQFGSYNIFCKIMAMINLLVIYEEINALNCDFYCLREISPPEFWRELFKYYLAIVCRSLIDLAIEYEIIECG